MELKSLCKDKYTRGATDYSLKLYNLLFVSRASARHSLSMLQFLEGSTCLLHTSSSLSLNLIISYGMNHRMQCQ
jgi:hypothetical protein